MAFASIPGGFMYPKMPRFQSSNPAMTTFSTIADNNDAAAYVIQCPKSGTLKSVQFRTGASPTLNDLKVTFQDVSLTTGDPDGVIDQFRVVTGITADAWFTTGLMTSDGTDGGTKRTVAKGDLLAIVILANATPINVTIACAQIESSTNGINFPYLNQFTTAWVGKIGRLSCIALQYDDDSYAEIWSDAIPVVTVLTDSISTNTTPDEVGLKFKLPFGYKVDGMWIKSNSAGDHSVVLYDSDGIGVLHTLNIDKDVRTGSSLYDNFRYFTAEITLLANVFYRLVIKPTTTTTMSILSFSTPSNQILDTMDGGKDFYYTSRVDAGSWTDTTTKRPWMGLRISAIDVSTGGGGERSAAYLG